MPEAEQGAHNYAAFAQELVDTCIISDPWVNGNQRFSLEPLVLSGDDYHALCSAGEALARVFQELSDIVWEEPALLDEFFHLTPYQKLMWYASGGAWHGIARLDLFRMADGAVQMCEMNSDTPSGEPEAVIVNSLRHRFHPELVNPNADFEERYCSMVIAMYNARHAAPPVTPPVLGIIYPTDMPEDLSMIELYRTWFEKRGCRVLFGSPYNLQRDTTGDLHLLDARVDVIIRHYKTDWWSERVPARDTEEDFADPDPLIHQLQAILGAETEQRVTVVNPFGSVITQNKLAMALCHSVISRFTSESRKAILAYIPETHRISDVDIQSLRREEWVLKSDYGCEGDEVVIGPNVTDEQWQAVLASVYPDRWIVQRYFNAAPYQNGAIPNYGLFVIGGKAAGIFTRLSSTATDYTAVTVPTFVKA